MSKSKKKSNRNLRKNLLILVLVFIILGAGYIYVKHYEEDPSTVTITDENLPDYVILENKDSLKYMTVVMYNHNININAVANTFYGNDAFWPYIFVANEDNPAVKANPLEIPKNTILKLPHLQRWKSMDGNIDPEAIERAKEMGDSLLNHLPSIN